MRTLGLAVLLLLIAAAPARAGWKMQRAQAIAATVWNHPCADQVDVLWARLGGGEDAAGDQVNCDVWLRANEPDLREWPYFCTVMIHEYGHVAGFRDPLNTADPSHSHSASSVMFGGVKLDRHTVHIVGGPTTTVWVGADRRCADNGRPYLERHGLLAPRPTSRRWRG